MSLKSFFSNIEDNECKSKTLKKLFRTSKTKTIEELEALEVKSLDLSSFQGLQSFEMDLSFLEYFSSLNSLNLAFQEVTNLKPLNILKNLKELNLSGLNINDLHFK